MHLKSKHGFYLNNHYLKVQVMQGYIANPMLLEELTYESPLIEGDIVFVYTNPTLLMLNPNLDIVNIALLQHIYIMRKGNTTNLKRANIIRFTYNNEVYYADAYVFTTFFKMKYKNLSYDNRFEFSKNS